MASFKDTFGDGCLLQSDNEKWITLDGERSIEDAVKVFTFEAGRPVSADEIEVDYVRFGFNGEDYPCWHTDGYTDGKKIWSLQLM